MLRREPLSCGRGVGVRVRLTGVIAADALSSGATRHLLPHEGDDVTTGEGTTTSMLIRRAWQRLQLLIARNTSVLPPTAGG